MKMERRFVKGATVRAAKGDKPQISGYSAVFGETYVLYDSASYRVVEKIKPGAFTRVLNEKQDTRGLFNHDPNNVLGRTTNGTLRLAQDDKGLQFENDLDMRTTIAQNVQAFIDREDVTGCSFAFTVSKQNWTEETNNGKTISTREIEEFAQLFDVGPVTYPAYEATSVASRSWLDGAPAELRSAIGAKLRDAKDGDPECKCGCRACKSAECDECNMNMATCGDEKNCDHSGSVSMYSVRGDKQTKRVDGEDLTSDCFIYVGDSDKPETWALPWKFSTDAKTKSHLSNALARFNQTQKIPADKKPSAWKKLVRLAKKYGIKVSDPEAKAWGFTAEQREDLRASVGTTQLTCQCPCAECQVGDCENCSDPDCDDDGCDHEDDDGDRTAALDEVDMRLRLAGLKATAVN